VPLSIGSLTCVTESLGRTSTAYDNLVCDKSPYFDHSRTVGFPPLFGRETFLEALVSEPAKANYPYLLQFGG